MTAPAPTTTTGTAGRGLVLIGVAIVLTGLNLRSAVTSVGPVLDEVEQGLGISSGAAGVITSLPVLCFALIGFTGPALAARFRDSHVLAAALLSMTAGLLLRALSDSFGVFVVGTVGAMVGGALGNVLLPGLVKRHFPTRVGLLVGAYSTAMTVGGASAAISTAPVAGSLGADGWRWALGIWAVPALVAAVGWLAVRARPGASRQGHTAVRMRMLFRSRLAWAMVVFFGVQAMEAYIVIGWTAQYLRDQGMAASTAGLLLGVNSIASIPLNAVVAALTVRQRLQRPMLAVFLCCYVAGFTGLMVAPLTATVVWMLLLAVAMSTFAMMLALLALRARTPESTAALSTMTQSWGYLLAAGGPLLVGVARGITGGYEGMFALCLGGVAVLAVAGWVACRERYVDDELSEPAGRLRD
ncbi:CynX/NimT family MFS transporter [Goekera deserti]|uniref:CynX/NimT family MFS transporter n=1 Tax=Goekera deserti TaxID=2497753 RepID=UPI001F2CF610|nr:MFS transporter [Goekera deserti]